jgi:hypothetical protein
VPTILLIAPPIPRRSRFVQSCLDAMMGAWFNLAPVRVTLLGVASRSYQPEAQVLMLRCF